MKAINTNSARALRKAIAIAPRAKRATELLNITVGTQSISPFYWAIDSGSLECAKAMIEDLLTIRADRNLTAFACICSITYLYSTHEPRPNFLLHGEGANWIRTSLPQSLMHNMLQ